ncbi:verprolin-like protein [Sporothrix brasiliensis 5110]|uniref:Verprolin-like protein n=1 Tax=Sporothrix brasiliensis 5110 TaxID=1398154 RepID=A0A0C2J150_9PEZI|nr:verprolin-like protein [Sporothrix brasiliensis 5110]KIH92735.1 verprolin-like protein [Sporothrix brasiliensis 5110]
MSDLALATHRGTLNPAQDRRAEIRTLNTIMEEADFSDASPVGSQVPMKIQQQQLYQQHQKRLHEERLREDRWHGGNEEREQKIDLWLSPMSDHFPTPRGFNFLSAPILPSSPSSASIDDEADIDDETSPGSNSPSSPWHHNGSVSTDVTEFDDIYNASDDESTTRKKKLRASGIGRYSSASRRTSSAMSRLSSSSEESRKMLPQLTIPQHPTISLADPDPKLCTSPMAPTPSAQVPMSPAIMSFMQRHHALDLPTVSAPPSLDGSLTSEQMSQMSAQMSAPPTPIIGAADDDNDNNGGWSGVQLQPDALATLQSLARSDAGSVVDINLEPERVIELPAEEEQPVEEMSENRSQPVLNLITSGLPRHTVPFSPAQQRSLAGLTRLEIPSPGGFFSGLSPRTRHTWNMTAMTPIDSAHPPTSGTAEQFYRLPWADTSAPPMPRIMKERPLHMPGAEKSSSPVEQFVEAPIIESDDPATAVRAQKTPVTAQLVKADEDPIALSETVVESVEIAKSEEVSFPAEEVIATEIVNDYLAMDAQKMQQIALGHLDRTEMWLVAQRAYLNGVADLTENVEEFPSPGEAGEEEAPNVPPKDENLKVAVSTAIARKKTVRFSEAVKSPALPRTLPSTMVHQESAYFRAFTDCLVRTSFTDMFIYRLPRFEALQAQRLLLREAHRNQLLGKYQLTVLPQSAKKRMSANVARGDDNLVDDPAKIRADKESDAQNQMALTTWHVAALRLLNGGRLISAPMHKRLARISRMAPGPNGLYRDRARILDLGGQATCDWAWHVGLQYPNAKVYSVTTKAIRQLSNANIRGPSNHRQVAVEKLTKLPFDDDQFDLVRAAELYSILKFVGENGEDEWESCLRECYRVLKPGGYIEFTVLDSDIVNAGPLGNAKSVEFGFVLQTLGYDPSPTKMFLGRLDRARFTDVRRAWMCLPVGPRPESLTKPTAARDSTGAVIPTVQLDAMVHGSTDNIAAVTGLAGSWSWERWLLRAEMEKTAGDLRLSDTVTAGSAMREASKGLNGVHAILEEGRTSGAAWRMLRGHARKPRSEVGTINMVLDMSF